MLLKAQGESAQALAETIPGATFTVQRR